MKNKTFSLRTWATPLTIASFLVVGVTGVLWFFGLVTGTARWMHEIIGLIIVAAVALHLALNWRAFKTYFRKPVAITVMAIGAAMTAYAYASADNQQRGTRPDFAVIERLGSVDFETLAPVFGETGDELASAFRAAGFAGADVTSSVATLTANDREQRMGAFAVLAAQ